MAEGWYTDPAAANPSMPTTMRYWDGKGWTVRTRPASRKEMNAWREAVAAERLRQAEEHAAYVETYVAEHGVVPPEVAAAATYTPRDVTPDGQLLAGWGQRFVAILIDGLLTGALSVLFGWGPSCRRSAPPTQRTSSSPSRRPHGCPAAGRERADRRCHRAAGHLRARLVGREGCLPGRLPQGVLGHPRQDAAAAGGAAPRRGRGRCRGARCWRAGSCSTSAAWWPWSRWWGSWARCTPCSTTCGRCGTGSGRRSTTRWRGRTWYEPADKATTGPDKSLVTHR